MLKSTVSAEGTEVAFDFVVEADEGEGHDVTTLGPHDADRLAGAAFEDLVRATSVK